jgi:dihydroorotase
VLEYAAQRDMTVFVHPTEPTLTAGGVIHEGDVAERLGLRGIPGFAEEIGLGILIPLVRRTRARVHIQRISTAKGVALLRQARAEGLPLTADVGFRHLLATHEAVASFDVHWKIDPPLRTEEDRQALWAGLLDKTIDCIVSHHVPIADEEKLVEFDQSPSGAIGLETVFSALWTARGRADTANYGVDELVNWLTHGPRRVLGLPPASSSEEEGTWWDLQAQWIPERAQMASLSGNCPEIGQTLTGVAVRLRRGGWDVEMPSV